MRTKIKHQLLGLLICILILPNVYGKDDISSAYKAFSNADYHKAKDLYESVINNIESSSEDKITSYQKLAYFAWKINENIDESRRFTELAFAIDPSIVNTMIFQAKYELAANNFEEAGNLIERALQSNPSEKATQKIRMAKANIDLQEAIYQVNNKIPLDREKLAKSLKIAEAISMSNIGDLDYAEIQLGLALLVKDGESAYKAWKNYFIISKGEKAEGILQIAENKLAHGFKYLNDDQTDDSDRNDLIVGLANSRFYRYADIMSNDVSLNDASENAEITDIKFYYEFCLAIDALSTNYHRDVIMNGLSDEKREAFYNQLDEIKQKLLTNLSWPNGATKLSNSNFDDELYQRFGTIFKDVKPYYNFHGKVGLFFMAHTISDKNIVVEQFGYKADVHFVELDFLFANSLTSWFFETKTGGVGGWNEGSLIVQMRRAYSDRPILYWERISDQEQKMSWKKRISELKITDEEIAKKNPYAYLPGLKNSMRYHAVLKLKNSLEKQGLTGDDLRMAFISEFKSKTFQSNIIGHEGRHRIDGKHRLVFEPFCRNYEYRAKLSEILQSNDPLFTLAFNPIYYSGIEGSSKHAYGGKKIVTQLVDWMNANQNTIAGFNQKRPTLPQLELLSEQQLIAAINTMEPLNSWKRKINPYIIVLLIVGLLIGGIFKLIKRRIRRRKNSI